MHHKNQILMKRFIPYFKKYRWILILDLLCASLTTLCELLFPLIVRFITDSAINNRQILTPKLILLIGLGYLLLSLINVAAYYFMASIGHIMGAKIETNMRRDLFSHMQTLSYSYYDKTKIGQLMSRITNDLFEVTEFAHHCPEEFFIAGLKIIVSFVILSTINLPLTLFIFSLIPLLLVFSFYFNKKMRKSFKRSRVQVGELNAQVENSLSGIRVVKSFANEKMEQQKFDEGNEKFLSIKKKMYHILAGFHSGSKLFDHLMYLSVLVVGTFFMLQEKIEVGDLVAYLLYVSTLLVSVFRIVEFTEQFQRGMTGIERFVEVMDTPPEIADSKDAIELKHVTGEIEFRNVSFRYKNEQSNVLTNINLHVNPGDNIALVGPSGSGKTTICNLLARFYDVTEGAILLDGINIKEIKQDSLHRNIGIVQQDVHLFSGSIWDNIAYGKPGASDEEIILAAKQAGVSDFIKSCPDGYDTYVGEHGVNLSGGQKQRISIARVFLKNPPVLILDEATSALDNHSEKIVKDSLEILSKGRTTFTIAHRLTTIKNASLILVLTENGIEEQGNHKELLKKGGIYADFYRMYTEL